jgi:hypothetical protein
MTEQPDLASVRHTNMLGPWDIPDDAFTEATYAAIAAC